MDLDLCTCIPGTNGPVVDRECEGPIVDIDFEEDSVDSEEDKVDRISIPGIGRVANFQGNDNIVLKAFSGSGFYTNFFKIQLKVQFTEPLTNGPYALATNADCDVKESVSVTADNGNIIFQIYQKGSDVPQRIVIPYAGKEDQNGWYDITLEYKRRPDDKEFVFTGQVGNTVETYEGKPPMTRYIDARVCALHLGYGYQYAGLVGYVDDFKVWRCDPQGIYVNPF